MKLTDIRRDYTQGGLRRANLKDSPVDQFNLWLEQAMEAGLTDPTAMTVATVDENGQPFQRIVLLKGVDERGFVFYTNLAVVRLSNCRKITELVYISHGIHLNVRFMLLALQKN
ncbi:pyeidoxamine 5'-phosphate oxidase [Vibrio ishigakensis]|uniref:Pyeidoxamine 5'-phosphate oxidase n=1 Tax=Vibrio ishigakensis TaxID=1481914 RepID=A0A0B8Q7D5_9VIBR|nr:pyeidoxamine 5'-phosphate oxidase [Vibrio ishigakensis]